MSEQIKFTCSCCGKEHAEWPALTFIAPDYYAQLSQEDKDTMAEIDSDFCVITHPDQTDRFIRVTLTQKVIDHCQDLQYGLWVSLSENSFDDYSANYNNENHETCYFGWLCNRISGYELGEGGSIPTSVYTKTGNQRPEIVPHDDFDHPFVHDYYNGITREEAERRIQHMLAKSRPSDGSR
ncbi:DUF2199 domain-containing protein [Paraflavitalea pollutisoli]|uniref:DUF2199 domain-containing protein n=1 Tax=Paraflavitalea pollutisoli TaxID=3034143 RepID=UPI0023EC5502|nr:DUF2199 domain-containing protein [Paraflavitalea sp. H1-2-19X]